MKNTVFTDGSPLTANDVVYSYNLARASSTIYASNLYEVSSVAAADTYTVVFNLTRHDPFFVKLLDFPILKTLQNAWCWTGLCLCDDRAL